MKLKSKAKNQMNSKAFAFLLSILTLFTLAACASNQPAAAPQESAKAAITADREGNPITLPDSIEKVISLGPSNTEILIALGAADRIIAADDYSPSVGEGETPVFSMMTPDVEQMISLEPDVIFVTGMSKVGGEDPFKVVADTGVCIVYIPTSASIEGIKEDIRFIAAVMNAEEKGETVVADMEKEIEAIRRTGETVTEKRSVYFEISAAPYMYSSGSLSFLNEMIELIGAENIFANEQTDWLSVSDEAVLSANPDVILTSVNYMEEPAEEIKSRPGWDGITAVKDDAVYYIDADASSRPSQNIVKALKEMAEAVYPDKYNF